MTHLVLEARGVQHEERVAPLAAAAVLALVFLVELVERPLARLVLVEAGLAGDADLQAGGRVPALGAVLALHLRHASEQQARAKAEGRRVHLDRAASIARADGQRGGGGGGTRTVRRLRT
jgi:hypothetical protein